MQHLSVSGRVTLALLALGLAALPAAAQDRAPQQPQSQESQPPVAPPKPYKVVAIDLREAGPDPSLDALRKQLAEAAQRKDRSALARLVVAKGFFWEREKGNAADAQKSSVDNLAVAITLDDPDGSGWQLLADYAAEDTFSPVGDRKDLVCSPSAPMFNDQEFQALFKDTGTDPGEWGFPLQDGIEVRESAMPDAKVVDKLGLHFVRAMPDDSPLSLAGSMLRIVTPAGKVGYVPIDLLSPLGFDQICYVKQGNEWKIAGYVGDSATQP